MEILDLRHFSSADLRPLLEDEIAMWGRVLSWDYAISAEMILRYMDAKILPGYAAIERGSIFGYSFFVYEQNKGVIGDLFVRDGARSFNRHEVEERLLTHVIETLQQSPGIHRVEAQLLAHNAGEVSRPFLQQGFSRHPRVFMNFDIGRHPQASLPTLPPLPPPFETRPWSEQEYQSAAALITAAYRGHVDSEINDQYRTLAGSLRFLNNIVRFPGCGTFDPQASFVVFERRTRTLVGLILCSQVRPDVGHITQVCVHPRYRRCGLARMLLSIAAFSFMRQGVSEIYLTVTEANTHAVELYLAEGYTCEHSFDAAVWERDEIDLGR